MHFVKERINLIPLQGVIQIGVVEERQNKVRLIKTTGYVYDVKVLMDVHASIIFIVRLLFIFWQWI